MNNGRTFEQGEQYGIHNFIMLSLCKLLISRSDRRFIIDQFAYIQFTMQIVSLTHTTRAYDGKSFLKLSI